tara:strand:- start:248 stop:643 length:396 start_codon:yes stop_codon:yes gene_type:complete
MPLVTLTFTDPINTSAQVGDMVYFIPTNTIGTTADAFNYNALSNGFEIGEAIAIRNRDGLLNQLTNPIQIDVNCVSGNCNVPSGAFIMFSKNKSANTSGVLGYYAKVKLTNNSKKRIELFSLGSDITINSQ